MALLLPDLDRGPGLWHFPDNFLEDNDFVTMVNALFHKIFPDLDPMLQWEALKADIKVHTQQYTKFCRKQHRSEIASLQTLLHQINKRIYQGEPLDMDRVLLQQCIAKCETTIWERSSTPENWALREGTMCPEFLHLEDELSQGLDIGQLYNAAGKIVQGDDVLEVMRDFYMNLYSNKDHVSTKDIQNFLNKLDIPKLKSSVEDTEVTEQERVLALMALQLPSTKSLLHLWYLD